VGVFEEDEEGEDDAGYHEGALEGEHGGSGMCVVLQPSWQSWVISSRKKWSKRVRCRSRRPMLTVVRGYECLVDRLLLEKGSVSGTDY
jgi:hypothetical protein